MENTNGNFKEDAIITLYKEAAREKYVGLDLQRHIKKLNVLPIEDKRHLSILNVSTASLLLCHFFSIMVCFLLGYLLCVKFIHIYIRNKCLIP